MAFWTQIGETKPTIGRSPQVQWISRKNATTHHQNAHTQRYAPYQCFDRIFVQIYRLTDPIRDAAFTGAGNAFISASRPNSIS
jgi:hypothetical protein